MIILFILSGIAAVSAGVLAVSVKIVEDQVKKDMEGLW